MKNEGAIVARAGQRGTRSQAAIVRAMKTLANWRTARAIGAIVVTALFSAACEARGGGPGVGDRRPPNVVLRADASERYLVIAELDGLAPPPQSLEGFARYAVSNPACVPLDHSRAFGGVRLTPRHDVPLAWVAVGPGHFRAVVTMDALRDEDYFGLGPCHWRLDHVHARFSAGVGRFVQVLSAAQIREQAPIEGHFLQRDLAASVGEREIFGEPEHFYDPRLGEHFVLRLSSRGLAVRTERGSTMD